MSKVVYLDTGVLGIVTHPHGSSDARECRAWLRGLLAAGAKVCVPEICDYELRREYLRNNSQKAIKRLDTLNATISYIPISTASMQRAAQLWANARTHGRPTADSQALDVDVILAAQAQVNTSESEELVVATTNVGHLRLFVTADEWRSINAA